MNISKNILSLGLIAVISGVSTAQTYTATAGTNGVTDIQSDYSQATGDGASVSVDVPLEFELPKKIALAVSPSGSFVLPDNGLFDGIVSPWGGSQSSRVIDTRSYNEVHGTSSYPNMSPTWVGYVGGIYANTSVSVTADVTPFFHESDPNSIIKGRWYFLVHQKDNHAVRPISRVDDQDSSTSAFPYTGTLDDTTLITNGNTMGFFQHAYPYIDTIDPTDRAGKYISTTTITLTAL